jgi:hypothetical protein
VSAAWLADYCLPSINVAHTNRFTNEETLAPDFAQKVADAVGIMAPFVHTYVDYAKHQLTSRLNDYIAPP